MNAAGSTNFGFTIRDRPELPVFTMHFPEKSSLQDSILRVKYEEYCDVIKDSEVF